MSEGGSTGPAVRRLLALVLVGLAPWTVVLYDGGVDLVFTWGLVTLDPLHVVRLDDWLFRFTQGPASLPPGLLAWPIGTVVYAFAVASATLSLAGVEPRRATAGLLVIAALANLQTVVRFARLGETVLPTGAFLCLALVWWFHWLDLRALVRP